MPTVITRAPKPRRQTGAATSRRACARTWPHELLPAVSRRRRRRQRAARRSRSTAAAIVVAELRRRRRCRGHSPFSSRTPASTRRPAILSEFLDSESSRLASPFLARSIDVGFNVVDLPVRASDARRWRTLMLVTIRCAHTCTPFAAHTTRCRRCVPSYESVCLSRQRPTRNASRESSIRVVGADRRIPSPEWRRRASGTRRRGARPQPHPRSRPLRMASSGGDARRASVRSTTDGPATHRARERRPSRSMRTGYVVELKQKPPSR